MPPPGRAGVGLDQRAGNLALQRALDRAGGSPCQLVGVHRGDRVRKIGLLDTGGLAGDDDFLEVEWIGLERHVSRGLAGSDRIRRPLVADRSVHEDRIALGDVERVSSVASGLGGDARARDRDRHLGDARSCLCVGDLAIDLPDLCRDCRHAQQTDGESEVKPELTLCHGASGTSRDVAGSCTTLSLTYRKRKLAQTTSGITTGRVGDRQVTTLAISETGFQMQRPRDTYPYEDDTASDSRRARRAALGRRFSPVRSIRSMTPDPRPEPRRASHP